MLWRSRILCFSIVLVGSHAAVVCAQEPTAKPATAPVDFNRQIRPLLSDRCFACHGPDAEKREANLRLDTREGAIADLEGHAAIVPSKPAESELLKRIRSTDPDERMPPKETGKTLTDEQIALIERWIAEGATYQTHWAFVSPERPALPAVQQTTWPRNAIDHFVLAELERQGLHPSAEASKETLIRRATLDLTGLPPTLAEIDAFLADNSAEAYEKLVDRLLASPRYAERMAIHWLDAARFADTNGYNNDEDRTMWGWREWVIEAFDRNLPFDQFVVEQIAGDLLPNATIEQQIATGFNRNHVFTTEGGIFPEEYRVEYVADRVHTTATVFLGLSLQCARCHDHKFDPLSQQEYYRFFAYFNNVADTTLGYNKGGFTEPVVRAASRAQRETLAKLSAELAASPPPPDARKAELAKQKEELEKAFPATMVMREAESPRQAFVLKRGQYDQPGDPVSPGIPAALLPLPADAPANRLGLAKWLVDPKHPLTSRVAVNRWWELYFGTGLVETIEDFGAQGALPSHPQLLDFLATELVRSGWNTKAMQRLIVTSATYRQTSDASREARQHDPANRLLSRGARFRLPAETIRDNALAIAGLLSPRIGGPSVRPYQPAGLWEDVSVERRAKYVPEEGENLYRRSMYTFWKRTCPPPGMTTFDAPDRETCVVRRARTNTPLQALVLLNDPTYVEAARKLAERVLKDATASDDTGRLTILFRLSIARPPSQAELQILQTSLSEARAKFAPDSAAAEKLLTVGAAPRDTSLNSAELAAWSTVANLVLNLDETISRK